MLREHLDLADDLDARDVRGYVAMRRIADAVGARMSVEYWKPAPYFLNFLDGYQLGEKVRKALDGKPDPVVAALLATTQLLDADTIDRRDTTGALPRPCGTPLILVGHGRYTLERRPVYRTPEHARHAAHRLEASARFHHRRE
ncbi:hypothetical protein E1258_18850 [Micromonospora sp. KC207]|uniref:hypothetical protein n=1 Tax=Micromonospora sp. KC207 TaxID=2530377 RepID=UPI00104A3EEC|nr:hypothetical protein [Micromonospora sp. KC207]TDC59178.1 hypothetical protein E1258_18850 [Micromonospora sp. KC207]